jgi:hypothetical protein
VGTQLTESAVGEKKCLKRGKTEIGFRRASKLFNPIHKEFASMGW